MLELADVNEPAAEGEHTIDEISTWVGKATAWLMISWQPSCGPRPSCTSYRKRLHIRL